MYCILSASEQLFLHSIPCTLYIIHRIIIVSAVVVVVVVVVTTFSHYWDACVVLECIINSVFVAPMTDHHSGDVTTTAWGFPGQSRVAVSHIKVTASCYAARYGDRVPRYAQIRDMLADAPVICTRQLESEVAEVLG